MPVDAQRNERRYCRTCGEDITQRSKYTNWTQCAYCYWKHRLENHEPLESLLQQRNVLKLKEEEIATLREQAEAELKNRVADLNRNQPRWKKWFGVTPSDERLRNLGSAVYRLQEELRDLTRQIDSIKRKIEAVRHVKKRFDSASHLRAVIAKNQRQAQELKEKFDVSSLSLANEMEYDRAKFKIRKKDYKRGNLLDNHFRNGIATHIISAFENKCLHCGGAFDLTLDHFAIPKNEGGNFVLSVQSDGTIKLNIVVLCRSCNSAKGELSYVDFFTQEKLAQAIRYQERLLRFVLSDEVTLRVIKSWYR